MKLNVMIDWDCFGMAVGWGVWFHATNFQRFIYDSVSPVDGNVILTPFLTFYFGFGLH